jgi:hypothetical protein
MGNLLYSYSNVNEQSEILNCDSTFTTTSILTDTKPSDTKPSDTKTIDTKSSDIYVIKRNKNIVCYLKHNKFLDAKIEHYMRNIFHPYLSSWDSYNFYIKTTEQLNKNTSLYKTILLFSRAKNFINSYDIIEEEIQIFKLENFNNIFDIKNKDDVECEDEDTENEDDDENDDDDECSDEDNEDDNDKVIKID